MAGTIISDFMMFLPERTKWFCLIGLCIFFFGIYIPYEEHKKKKKQAQKRTPEQPKHATSEKTWDQKKLEQLKTMKTAGKKEGIAAAMKYMTFNSSCSYAGLANLMSYYGVDAEDRTIALRMGLPYLFAYEDGQYLSGPMLQGARWFNLYLHPIGFTLTEHQLGREKVCPYLQANPPAMLGLRVTPTSKHAVIYTGSKEGEHHFLNNKRQTSPEPETLNLTESDLLSRLDEMITIGILEKIKPVPVSLQPYLEKSLVTLHSLQSELIAFCSQEQSPAAQQQAMEILFRPILLDGVTMLELLGEEQLASSLRAVRTQFMKIVRESRPAVLSSHLNMSLLTAAMTEYAQLIAAEMETICP